MERNDNGDERFKFTGKEQDAETGFNYFGARYYDAGVSVWLSVDPMAHKYTTLTPYAYVAQNPVILTDPNGCEIKVTRRRYRMMEDGTKKRLYWYNLRKADVIEVEIRIKNMKIIDLTGRVDKKKLEAEAEGIQQELTEYWNTSNSDNTDEDGYITNKREQKLKTRTVFENNIAVAESKESIDRKDHVIAITDSRTLERHGGPDAGMTLIHGSMNSNILLTTESYMASGYGDYAHEFGHMLGLNDVMFYRKGIENERLMYNGAPCFGRNKAKFPNNPLPHPSYKEFNRARSNPTYYKIDSI